MRLAIFTGGSRGLGAALCKIFKDNGFELIEFSRSAPYPYSVQTDLSDPGSASAKFSEALSVLSAKTWKEIVVFNNAGTILPVGPTGKKEPKSIIQNANINYTSALLFITEVVSAFQDHKCKKTLVNISSGAAKSVRYGWSLYCAAKAGMENFIRALANEQSRETHPFTVVNINPGLVDTEMQTTIRNTSKEDFPDKDLFLKRKEKGELRNPRETASELFRIVEEYSLENGSSISLAF
ncbi:short chain dehydrogenase [Chitinispirillum alkaliphilum]|nr:short chain dehydrogenase [Chitinispirillum alkaliphilum]